MTQGTEDLIRLARRFVGEVVENHLLECSAYPRCTCTDCEFIRYFDEWIADLEWREANLHRRATA